MILACGLCGGILEGGLGQYLPWIAGSAMTFIGAVLGVFGCWVRKLFPRKCDCDCCECGAGEDQKEVV